MEKFYLKNGKEVQIGDTLIKRFKAKDSILGELTSIHCIVINESTIPVLLKTGIIHTAKSSTAPKTPTVESKIPMNMEYYIKKIADKLNWKVDKAYNFLNTIDSIYPAAALSIILKEIAIELDKQYKDDISKSPEIYIISSSNGKIGKINKANIKNYRNFAAFRTIEDAKIACRIVKDILKESFKSGKQED